MKAWIIDKVTNLEENDHPLKQVEIPVPEPREGDLLLRVKACGVCHTEIDEIEGRTPPPVYPVIPGHQVVGIVEDVKGRALSASVGKRVGVAWIYSSCGNCEYCNSGRENLVVNFWLPAGMLTEDMPNIC